jgi:hypothetical protein
LGVRHLADMLGWENKGSKAARRTDAGARWIDCAGGLIGGPARKAVPTKERTGIAEIR